MACACWYLYTKSHELKKGHKTSHLRFEVPTTKQSTIRSLRYGRYPVEAQHSLQQALIYTIPGITWHDKIAFHISACCGHICRWVECAWSTYRRDHAITAVLDIPCTMQHQAFYEACAECNVTDESQCWPGDDLHAQFTFIMVTSSGHERAMAQCKSQAHNMARDITINCCSICKTNTCWTMPQNPADLSAPCDAHPETGSAKLLYSASPLPFVDVTAV